MPDEIINNEVEKVVITYKDRLSRVDFDLISYLFKEYRTDIVVISEIGSTEQDTKGVFHDIECMLRYYSMKMYSKRRNKSIEVWYDN